MANHLKGIDTRRPVTEACDKPVYRALVAVRSRHVADDLPKPHGGDRPSLYPLARNGMMLVRRITVAGPASPHVNVDRRSMLLAASAIVATAATLRSTDTKAQTSVPLASWNEGPAKQAILDFVSATTDQSSKAFVSPEGRSATFDQDGTLWTEHPLYAQAAFALYRVHELAPQHPEWQTRSHSSRRYPTIWRLWANSPNAIGSRSSLPPLRDEHRRVWGHRCAMVGGSKGSSVQATLYRSSTAFR